MYSDSGDDSCDEKMMLTIETIHPDGEGDEKQLVMIRPGASSRRTGETARRGQRRVTSLAHKRDYGFLS